MKRKSGIYTTTHFVRLLMATPTPSLFWGEHFDVNFTIFWLIFIRNNFNAARNPSTAGFKFTPAFSWRFNFVSILQSVPKAKSCSNNS